MKDGTVLSAIAVVEQNADNPRMIVDESRDGGAPIVWSPRRLIVPEQTVCGLAMTNHQRGPNL
jgi:hypothetical protein